MGCYILTLKDIEKTHLSLLTLEECISLLGEPPQTLPDFIRHHPMLGYLRLDSKTYRFKASDIVDLINARNATHENKGAVSGQDMCRHVPTPEELLYRMDMGSLIVEKTFPQAYLCFISDGTYVKIAATVDVAKYINSIKSAHTHPLKLLFAIPLVLYDRIGINGYGKECSDVATDVLELVFIPFHVKNGWYDVLSALDINRYMEFFNISDHAEMIMDKIGTGVPSSLKGSFRGYTDNISPQQLHRLLLNYKVPIAKNTIESFVYFISDGQYVKIGFTENVKARLKALCNKTYKDLSVLFTVPIGRTYRSVGDTVKMAESIIHEIFADHHVNGEWYDVLNKIDYAAFRDYYGALCLPGKESLQEYKQIIQNRSTYL